MTASTLRIETDTRGVAKLTMTRAAKHNAIDAAMMAELFSAINALGADRQVRAVVLAAEGKSFSAGADLAWMQAQFSATREERINEARKFALVLNALNEVPKFTLARVQGPVFGGGIGLIAACDCVIASEAATFALTEARLGLIPATISPYVMAKIGESGARRMMSGRRFDVIEAMALGLVSKVSADLDSAIEAELEAVLQCAAPAIAAAKSLFRAQGHTIDMGMIEDTIARLADAWEMPDAQERIAAFLAKSK
jgi:methylglutaconyl-CoA hydratase